MNMRLIDANEYPCRKCGITYCYGRCDEFWNWLEREPAIELVHCVNCKHFKHDEVDDEWWCRKSGVDIEYVDALKHFCSYGERKN